VVPWGITLPVEVRRSLGHLEAGGRELGARGGRVAERHVVALGHVGGEVVDALVSHQQCQQAAAHQARSASACIQGQAAGGDRPCGHLVVGQSRDHHVLVSVVVVGRRTHLRPLPAEVGHGVGIGWIAGHLVALADRVDRLGPVLRADAFGVVVDGPEVELRAEARVVARVGRRVSALSSDQRQAGQEGVEGEGRVDVEVAEEDLLRPRHPQRGGGGSHLLLGFTHRLRGALASYDFPRALVAAEVPLARDPDGAEGGGQQQGDHQENCAEHGGPSGGSHYHARDPGTALAAHVRDPGTRESIHSFHDPNP
jgi:hypothetical protein